MSNDNLTVTFTLKNGSMVRVNFATHAVPAVMDSIARYSWLDRLLGRNSSIGIYNTDGLRCGCIRISEIAAANTTA
jgi:hypothetical protein